MKVGVSAGVGGADLLTEYIDKKQGYTKPFQNITDYGRLIYTAGGYVANYMDFGDDDITETMVLAGIPLLEKSIAKAFSKYVLKGKAKGRMGLKIKHAGGQTGNIRWG